MLEARLSGYSPPVGCVADFAFVRFASKNLMPKKARFGASARVGHIHPGGDQGAFADIGQSLRQRIELVGLDGDLWEWSTSLPGVISNHSTIRREPE